MEPTCAQIVFRRISEEAINNIWTGNFSRLAETIKCGKATVSEAIAHMADCGIIEYLEQGIFGAPSKLRVVGVEPTSRKQSTWITDEIDATIIALRKEDRSCLFIAREILTRHHISVTSDMIVRRTRTLGVNKGVNPIKRLPDGSFTKVYGGTGANAINVRPQVIVARPEKPAPIKVAKAPRAKPMMRSPGKAKLIAPKVSAPSPRDAAQQKTRSPSGYPGFVSSAAGWSMGTLPKPLATRVGICRWALACDKPGDPFCVGHTTLIRGARLASKERETHND